MLALMGGVRTPVSDALTDGILAANTKFTTEINSFITPEMWQRISTAIKTCIDENAAAMTTAGASGENPKALALAVLSKIIADAPPEVLAMFPANFSDQVRILPSPSAWEKG